MRQYFAAGSVTTSRPYTKNRFAEFRQTDFFGE